MNGKARESGDSGTVYVWAVVAAGAFAIAVSLRELSAQPLSLPWIILTVLTLLASAATLRMSSVQASFSVADVFSFAAVLLFGPAAGTLNVAIDCLMISGRLARKGISWRRVLFNATAPALAMWVAAHAVYRVVDLGELASDPASFGYLLAPLGVLAGLFFLLDTGLIALAVALSERSPVFRIWTEHFATLWLSFFGGAYAAGVLVLFLRQLDMRLLVILIPLPLILYYALKHWLGRLDERVRHLRELQEQQSLREQAEEALRDREAQLSAVFDNALDALVLMDDERRFIDANPAACEILGVPRSTLRDLRVDEFLLPELAGSMSDRWQEFLRSGQAKGEWRIMGRGGRQHVVEYSARAHVLPGRHLSIWRDVTERKRLEDQLRHAQKMETVGRLAGGIAHDFNNLLTAIMGYNNLVLDRVSGEVRDDVQEVQRAAERAAALTGRLLAFSRKQVLQPVVVQINQLVGSTQKMLGRLIGENVDLRTRLATDLWAVKVDPTQMEQVLVNLVVNARDAMLGGGRLTVETSNVDAGDSTRTDDLDVPAGRYIRIAITDSGTGMDEDVKSHLFEPFFTTKARGKGTGLGLATVYGIVQQSNGHIRVDSVPGVGTTFRIYLPATDASEPREPAAEAPAAFARGSETILLAEDEAPVRGFVRRALEGQGYRVIETHNADEALAAAARYRDDIDLLLTDIAMPGMSGRELARRLLADMHDLKVVFMSGYSEELIGTEPGVVFMQKPFTQQALAALIRSVLDARTSARL